MPNSAIKACPTVSAHAILSRRRRRHDIILIAPFALSPSNFAIFSHRPLDREGWSLRVKRKAPHPPLGAGRNHALCAYGLRGETVLGPASSGRQFTEWGRHSGSTHVRNKNLRDDSAADHRY
jgi:hypothetical protein